MFYRSMNNSLSAQDFECIQICTASFPLFWTVHITI